jgi:hypothetical protein
MTKAPLAGLFFGRAPAIFSLSALNPKKNVSHHPWHE